MRPEERTAEYQRLRQERLDRIEKLDPGAIDRWIVRTIQRMHDHNNGKH